ncbi:Na+/H+ antiporter [Planctomicrobium sp. SH668]|uniref:Na+/H+ antiporter n=1 Tax=Planctomicrobium sp. SH668 TaxID=3448126 RepID=UPI003F5C6D66
MNPAELIIGLMFLATILSAIAARVGVAYPIVLVLGGLILSFTPGVPLVQIPPDVIFLVFIPPLIYQPAAQVALMDFKSSWFPIAGLSFGLVFLSLLAVSSLVCVILPGFTWPMALVLAAILAPTDLIAVNAITNRTPIPRDVATVLDGENLFNDVVAFVAYKIAIGAVISGVFTVQHTLAEFAWDSVFGILTGLAVGAVSIWIRSHEKDPVLNSAISLMTSFAAYLTGEAVGASGVLSTVTAGLFVGGALPRILQAETRQSSSSFWSGLKFLLEGLAFVLIGLELRPVLASLSDFPRSTLFRDAALICSLVILLRLVWVAGLFGLRLLIQRVFQFKIFQSDWRNSLIVAWCGTRGLDSLAAALAIPLLMSDGVTPFPNRELIIFHAVCVIFVTLLFQGATLPLLIRWLNVPPDESEEKEVRAARFAAAQAAISVLEVMTPEDEETAQLVEQMRRTYEKRARRFSPKDDPHEPDENSRLVVSSTELKLKVLDARRAAVLSLRGEGLIGSSAYHQVERILDLEEMQIRS